MSFKTTVLMLTDVAGKDHVNVAWNGSNSKKEHFIFQDTFLSFLNPSPENLTFARPFGQKDSRGTKKKNH